MTHSSDGSAVQDAPAPPAEGSAPDPGPYRSELETLRANNELLRAQVAQLQAALQSTTSGLHTYPRRSAFNSHCRLCDVGYEDKTQIVSMRYELPYRPSWLGRLFGRRPHPGRFRRECRNCLGVYYELAPTP